MLSFFPSFNNSFAFFLKKLLTFQNLAKMKYIYKKSSNQEIFSVSLSSCSRYNANFKLDQSVFAIHDSPLYFEISEDDHPRTRLLMNFILRYCFPFPGIKQYPPPGLTPGTMLRAVGSGIIYHMSIKLYEKIQSKAVYFNLRQCTL